MKFDEKAFLRSVDTIKFLSADAIQKANSGHPGACWGAADMVLTLWTEYLRYDPKDPWWFARDRFILSAGHASMLLYSMLHLAGYDVPMDELRRFRQLGSKTPGHPERGCLPGVELTTGPLGQGFAHGVGIALASRMMAARFPRLEGWSPFDWQVYALVSDGDLMEGISSEAASLAGYLQLGNLIYLYDDNKITIEGSTGLTFVEDVAQRFTSYGWHVERVDGYNREEVSAAIQNALQIKDKPSLIIARTVLAHGAGEKENQPSAHGSPLGEDIIKATKQAAGWDPQKTFFVPEDVRKTFELLAEEKTREHRKWEERFGQYKETYPEKWKEAQNYLSQGIDPGVLEELFQYSKGLKGATRKVFGSILKKAGEKLPFVVGGSADLAPSTKTVLDGGDVVRTTGGVNYRGRNLHFGIREHAMGAVINGLTISGFFKAFGSTFLVFSDYLRPALRLAALMKTPSVYVFSHDSVFLGEDGPTHQPIEHLASIRAIPGVYLFRPANGAEAAAALEFALIRKDGPTVIVTTRQGVPEFEYPPEITTREILKGGYAVKTVDQPDVILVATGSEVPLAVESAGLLEQDGIKVRVVSMPCVELFIEQPQAYKDELIPDGVPVVVLEAASPFGWHRIAGKNGLIIGIDTFGESAPFDALKEFYGFTPEAVARKVRSYVGK